ncbi:MAG: hypothetical protein JNM19_18200 [Chitinophagaceae bacterium]|nr:hypothetical protein [Chitinophagaceae bacterium]
MKYLLMAFLLFSLVDNSRAQDTTAANCKLIKETDPYTKETKLSTGFIFLDGGSVTIDADSKEIIVLFSLDGAEKCFDNNSTAEVYFEGLKSKTLSRNQGTMNCEGLFQFVFRNSRSNPTTLLQRIMTKKITHIIFTGNSKKPVTVTVGPAEQEAIMAQATCLVNDGRGLIK